MSDKTYYLAKALNDYYNGVIDYEETMLDRLREEYAIGNLTIEEYEFDVEDILSRNLPHRNPEPEMFWTPDRKAVWLAYLSGLVAFIWFMITLGVLMR